MKGGISYDPANDRWRSRDADGIRHIIKNPFDQARKAKHNILQKLRDSRAWPEGRFVRARHAVVFPDSEKPTSDLGADRPLELICSRSEMRHLREWIETRLCGGDEEDLGQDGVRALENLLAKPFALEVPLGHVLEDADREIGILTQDFWYTQAQFASPAVRDRSQVRGKLREPRYLSRLEAGAALDRARQSLPGPTGDDRITEAARLLGFRQPSAELRWRIAQILERH